MSIIRQLSYSLVKYNTNCFSTLTTRRPQILKHLKIISNEKMSSFKFSSVDVLQVEHNPKEHQFFVKLGKGIHLYTN